MSRWLRLYPATWRRRYGDELEALLSERRPGPRDALDLLRGALDARLHPRVANEYAALRTMAMTSNRDDLRTELHAVLAAHTELGPEHEGHLIESLLDRLDAGEFLPPRRIWRSVRLRLSLLAASLTVVAGTAITVHRASLPAEARHLPEITLLESPPPVIVLRMPLRYQTGGGTTTTVGPWVIDDYGGKYPYAFVQFFLRYKGCAIAHRAAMRVTIQRADYQITGRTRDGRVFDTPTSSWQRWTTTSTFYDRTFTGSLSFPTPEAGLYRWQVEVPGARTCAWSLDVVPG